MTSISNRINELNDAGIDCSMPINRFAKKAKAIVNRLARETKQVGYSNGYSYAAEYGDGVARVYLNTFNINAAFFMLVDTAIRKMAKKHEVSKAPLRLPIVDITLGNDELTVAFC